MNLNGVQPNEDRSVKSIAATEESPLAKYMRWKREIELAEKDQEDWHKRAEKVIKKYKDDRDAIEVNDRKFNVFTANVDTLQSAMYAAPPKVEISRKFKDMDDDVSRVAANILERTLSCDLDEVDSPFSDVILDAIWDRLVPGAGVVWLRIKKDEGDEREIVIERVHWKDFFWSPCRTWAERRWIARKVYMDYDSGIRRFGEVFRSVPLDFKAGTTNHTNNDTSDPKQQLIQQAQIYEIWDRQARKVIWISKGYPVILDEKEDFLGLENFEPCPKPLFASMTTSKVEPIPDYVKSQDQYEELNVLHNRLSLLYRACKVTGVYNKSADGIQRMLLEGYENTLVPVDNWAMFAEQGGLKGQVDWLPLESIVTAINQLTLAATAKKQEIYELTGISDIVRGATRATETASAQKLKANFASARQQSFQSQVEDFVCNIMKIKAEMLVKHFDANYFITASNIMATPDQQFVGPAIQLLQNNQAREYRISIKPESMAQVDYASEKADRMELLTVVGNYLEKSVPLVQANPAMAELAIAMLKFGVAGFKAGKEFEGVLDSQLAMVQQMQRQAAANPQPEKPSPEEIKAQASMAELNAKLQADGQRMQFEAQKQNADLQLAQIDIEKARAELQIKQQELGIKREELAIKARELQLKEAELTLAAHESAAAVDSKNREIDLAENELGIKSELERQALDIKAHDSVSKVDLARESMENDRNKPGKENER